MTDLEQQTKPKFHRWTGWPGAHCMKCGSDDYMELAIGDGWFEPFTEKWDTEEHKLEYNKYKYCQVSDKEWYEHLVNTRSEKEAKIFFPDGIPTE
jgi:hypothetical protein